MSDRGAALKPEESAFGGRIAAPAFDRGPGELGFSGEHVRRVPALERSVREDMEVMRLSLTREMNSVKSELRVLSRRVGDLESQPALGGFEGRLDMLEARMDALIEALKRCMPPHTTRHDSGSGGSEGA